MRRWSLQTRNSCRPISKACHKPGGFIVQRQVCALTVLHMQAPRGGGGAGVGIVSLSNGARAVNTYSHRPLVGVDRVVSEIKKLNVSDIAHS